MNPLSRDPIRRLEIAYGVQIDESALYFATTVHRVYGDKSIPKNDVALGMVERACRKLRKSLSSDREERKLDWDEYYLDRAFVEVMELRKEKSAACRSVLPLAEKELAECTGKLECFQSKWAPVVAQLRREAGRREFFLRHIRDELDFFIYKSKLLGCLDLGRFSQVQSLLNNAYDQLQHTIHSAARDGLVVGPREIAQVASSMTRFPLKCFYPPFHLRLMMPRIEDLKSRLSENLIGLDDVIHKIMHALSKQKSLSGPLGSFLLLGPHGCGRTKLAKALAEEIYGDKDRVIKLDLSQYTNTDHISSLLHVLDRDKKYGKVVMFDNIENAQACMYEILSQILWDGRLSNGTQMSINFSDDLVLVSSHIGHEAFCYCRCLRDSLPNISFQEILKEPALLHAEFNDKTCYLHDFFTKVANQFRPEFVDQFYDVVVFPWLTPQNHMAIARLQMRDVATSMSTSLKKKKVILYPSDAAVQNMVCYQETLKKGAHAYETWHKVYMDPMLNNDVLKNQADDTIIIHIDALIGLRDEFSFRVENSRHLQKDPTLKSSKNRLRELRNGFCQVKLQVDQLYRLLRFCINLIKSACSKDPVDYFFVIMESQNFVGVIDELLINEASGGHELEPVQLDDVNTEKRSSQSDRKRKRARKYLKRLAKRLKRSLKEQAKATQAITDALRRRVKASYKDRSNKSSHLPASFLCLGLTPESKKQFAKSLEEHLVGDDGEKLFFQVDLSLCTEPNSFFRGTHTMDTHQLLMKVVKKRPHCVIVFHGLEMADISVFSTILSILDDGVSKDDQGKVTNFGKSVIVIVSDLGNSEMIGGLNGHRPKSKCPIKPIERESTSNVEAAVGSSQTDKMGYRGLRFELLYRLDKLLLFDPFSDDQLNHFAKSPLKSLEEKSHSLYSAFAHLFDVQGKKDDDADKNIKYIKEALGKVVKKIRGNKHKAGEGSSGP